MHPLDHAQQPDSGLPIAGPPPGYDAAEQYALPSAAGEIERYTPPPAPSVGSLGNYQTPVYQPAVVAEAYGRTPAYPLAPAYQQPHDRQEPAVHQQQPAAPVHHSPPPTRPVAHHRPSGYRSPGYSPAGRGSGAQPSSPPAAIVTAAPPEPAARRSGAGRSKKAGRTVALIALAALFVVGGAGAVATDAWAKRQVCDTVKRWSGYHSPAGGAGGDASGESYLPTVAEVDGLESALNKRASLLFFHGDLKLATHELANDFATVKPLVQSGKLAGQDDQTLTRLVALAGSLDTHTREAERACGLPERSLLGTTA
jgi:hypothetical protein